MDWWILEKDGSCNVRWTGFFHQQLGNAPCGWTKGTTPSSCFDIRSWVCWSFFSNEHFMHKCLIHVSGQAKVQSSKKCNKLNRLHTHSCLEVAHRSILPQTDVDLRFEQQSRPAQWRAPKTRFFEHTKHGLLSCIANAGICKTCKPYTPWKPEWIVEASVNAWPSLWTALGGCVGRLSFEHLRICIRARRSENWNKADGQPTEFEGLEPKSWYISSECQWWAASWRVWNPCSRNHNLPIDVYFASSDIDRRKCEKPQNNMLKMGPGTQK